MTSKNCQHCGSEEDPILSGRYFRKYKCDSTQWIDRYTGETRLHQSEDCMRIELAALRSQNRDLQQAYDHVLECEQNRCREVVELQGRLAELRRRIDEAPVARLAGHRLIDGGATGVNPDTFETYRLICDDQPGETDA